MFMDGSPPTIRKNTEKDSEFCLLCDEELAPLKAEASSLLRIADRLDLLAGNLDSSGLDGQARVLAADLRAGLAACLEKEAAVLRGVVDQPPVGALRNAMDRTRREYAALRGLAAPVLAGLRALGQNRFPTPVNRFVFATNVLCVFVRMHVQFKNETLYPLLAGSQPSGQAHGDTGRSPQNGARTASARPTGQSGARKTEDRSAHEWRQRKKSILGRQRKRVPPPDPRTADMLVRLFGGPVPRNKVQKDS